MALFIKPAKVKAGPFTLHGDGRDFSSNSDPGQSRGYAWIDVNTGEAETHMNPSGYDFNPLGDGFTWFDPSRENTWFVSKGKDGSISVQYDLVVSGPLNRIDVAPHINGTITFQPDGQGGWQSSFTRDGFPWAEAYYHDGKGNVQTIFQDPAVRGNPYDLFAIEPGMSWMRKFTKRAQDFVYGESQISRR